MFSIIYTNGVSYLLVNLVILIVALLLFGLSINSATY